SATLHIDVSAGVLNGIAPTGLAITYDGPVADVLDGSAAPSVELKLAGASLTLPVGDVVNALLTPLNDELFGDGAALDTFATTLTTDILVPLAEDLKPAFGLIGNLLSLKVNG